MPDKSNEKAKEIAEKKEKETIGVLKLYNQLQAIERKLKRTGTEEYNLNSSENYDEASSGNTNSVYSDTEEFAVRKVAAQQDLPELRDLLQDIDEALDTLTPERYQAIRHKYFKGVQVVNIQRELEKIFNKNFSRTTIYRRLSNGITTLRENNLWSCYRDAAETVYHHRGKLQNIEDETLLKHF